MPKKALVATAVVTSSLFVSTSAVALEFKPYLFGSAGYANSHLGMLEEKHEAMVEKSRQNGGSAMLNVDDDAFSAVVGIGAQLHRYFALELSYYDLGSHDIKANGSYSEGLAQASANGTAEVDVTGWGLQGVIIAPFTDNFSGTLSLGVAGIKTKVEGVYSRRINSPLGTEISSERYEENSREIVGNFGAGARYAINESIALRLTYNYLGGVGRYETAGESRISMVNAGMAYHF